MAEDKPLPVELPAPALKEAQHRVLRVQAANDRFGAPVITRQTNPGMTHFHPLSRFGWRRSMAGMGHEDQFPLRRLTARSVIRKRTVAATRGNGRDAPKAVTQGTMIAGGCDAK
jgi:hypothetical protein